jgi:hypothetical protein
VSMVAEFRMSKRIVKSVQEMWGEVNLARAHYCAASKR